MGQACNSCAHPDYSFVSASASFLLDREKNGIAQRFKKAMETQDEPLIRQLVDEHEGLHLLGTVDREGKGVLHIAVQQQNLALAQYFLSAGLSANEKNPHNGDTPLHIASRLRNLEIVSLLTKYNADTNIPNHNNETPLTIASNILRDYNLIVQELSLAAIKANKENSMDKWVDTNFAGMKRDLRRARTMSLLSAAKQSVDTVPQVHKLVSLSGCDTRTYSLAEVAKHTSMDKGIWIIIGELVYDITSFIKLSLHPATNAFIEPYYGRDATEPFDSTFHSLDAVRALNKYEIGRVCEDDLAQTQLRHATSFSSQASFKMARLSETVGPTLRSKLRVTRLFIYPVKGMKGISVQKAKLTLSGFVDDRIYAVVHKATNKAVNQLTYTQLSQIVVAFKDGTDDCDAGIQLNDHFVPFVKDKTLSVEWKSCSTKILVYDQGEAVSKWITSYLNQDGGSDEFIFVRIHEENHRNTEEYFALPFATKETQIMSAFQNY
eukprot:190060_1